MYNENSFFEFADPTSKVIQFKNNTGNIVFGLNVCHLPKIATEGNLIWVFNHGKVTSLDFINETAAKLAHNMLMEAVDSLQLNCEVGGGGGALLVETTYPFLVELKAAEALVPGTFYKITDRGDQGIIIQALSTTELSQQGVRFMNCPITYQTTGLFLGVWHTGLTPVAGEKVIWGGKVFVNRFDKIGTAETDIKLDDDNWTEVSKPAYGATNANYTTLQFEIQYDFDNDWVMQQKDGRNNVVGFGTSSLSSDWLGFATNPVDLTDWNMFTLDDYFYNNHVNGGIFNNKIDYIYDNKLSGQISGNIGGGIYANSMEASDGASIRNNNIWGDIYNNTIRGTIQDNLLVYNISDNSNDGGINNNSNNGSIYKNSNKSPIANNTNNGDISENLNVGAIENNSNGGRIGSNTNTGSITQNSNNGEITSNSNKGTIESNINGGFVSYNTNNGSIYGNSNTTNIYNNSNLDAIQSNSNTGGISFNSNNGNINNNTVTVLDIAWNSNSGVIGSNANIGSITKNANLGNIISTTSSAANITENGTTTRDITVTATGTVTDAPIDK